MQVEMYNSDFGWEWQLVAENGEVLCHPGETFSSKQKCRENLELVKKFFCETSDLSATIVEVQFDQRSSHRGTGEI